MKTALILLVLLPCSLWSAEKLSMEVSYQKRSYKLVVEGDQLNFKYYKGKRLKRRSSGKIKLAGCKRKMVKGFLAMNRLNLREKLENQIAIKNSYSVYAKINGESKVYPYNSPAGKWVRQLPDQVMSIIKMKGDRCI